ncbi:MAG: four helix bundle protein [Bacteroidales bacterium]|nr:four helix bundle protein [Bacteroidales bacterium]
MRIEELKLYQLAMEIAEEIWEIVKTWDHFAKDTIGKQLVRSADGIASNISEGFGRYHYKESKLFYYYARGSLYETRTWITKACNRGLLQSERFLILKDKLAHTNALLNNYIKTVGP